MLGKTVGLLLLGAAAYGVYKYSKLSDQEKEDLMDKGKKFFEENLNGLKNIFGQAVDQAAAESGFSKNGAARA